MLQHIEFRLISDRWMLKVHIRRKAAPNIDEYRKNLIGKRNIFIVQRSSGIGLELVEVLCVNHHEVQAGSRTEKSPAEIPGVLHLAFDVLAEFLDFDALTVIPEKGDSE